MDRYRIINRSNSKKGERMIKILNDMGISYVIPVSGIKGVDKPLEVGDEIEGYLINPRIFRVVNIHQSEEE